jgi:hypothetical protein
MAQWIESLMPHRMKDAVTQRWAVSSSLSCRKERIAVLLLCAMAAARVFLFSAAFPFFNNVDERRHFDLVMKYASGHLPRGAELISPATLPYLSRYASPEFLAAPENFEGGYYGPLWTHPAEEIAPTLAAIEEIWGRTPNQECSQPPLYYVVAAVWFHVGQWIGVKGGTVLYWIRFLNVALIAALVWLAYAAARIVFPDRVAMRVGVPLLVAFIPQDAFMGSRTMSCRRFVSASLSSACFVGFGKNGRESVSESSIAAAYLTKLSNLPLIVVAIGAIAYWCAGRVGSRKLRDAIPALSALVCCAAIPIAAWMIWIKSNFGDFTGSASKAELLGWTAKPFSDWWSHPIFTLSGFWAFLSELIASFWRGEFMWHAHTIGWKGMDMFYVVSSLGFFLVAGVSLLRRRTKDVGAAPRRALWIAAASFIAAIAFLGFLSLQFDFGSCINPSRERPYFFQGRLMSGAMIPFALLYVYGLHRLLRALPALVLPALVAIATAITISESFANGVAFASVYNWFHM